MVIKVFVSYINVEVFMKVTVPVVAFWVMAPYSFISGHQCFGGTYSLHLQH
jgi:hypothetical protein